jgi:transaldolase
VSLEVSPMLAHDSEGTIKEARLLWDLTGRPNIFIKVPGTKEGLAPIRKLIREGINVNSTLLFGIPRYREVAEAYMSGLEDRLASGRAITAVTSVASFFLSRIDTLIDPLLEEKMKTKTNESRRVAPLHGAMAIASAKIAYHIFREEFSGKRFKKLVHAGACLQRVLWASTGTKNPGYSDVKYVEALIGPETITTLPPETITAYRDHGKPSSQLSKGVNESKRALKHLAEIGIQLNEQTQKLEEEGVLKFKRSYEDLLAAIKKKSSSA